MWGGPAFLVRPSGDKVNATAKALTLGDFRRLGWIFVKGRKGSRWYKPGQPRNVRWFACPIDCVNVNGEGYKTLKEAKGELTKYLSLKTLPAAVESARQLQADELSLFRSTYPL